MSPLGVQFLLLLFLLVERAAGQPSELKVSNEMDTAVQIAWLAPDGGEPVYMATVAPRAGHSLRSFVGHAFRFTRDDATVAEFVVASAPLDSVTLSAAGRVVQKSSSSQQALGQVIIAEAAEPDEAECERVTGAAGWNETVRGLCAPAPHERRALEQRIAVHRAAVQGRKDNERRREYLNREQPRVVPIFTKVGFEKLLVPDALWSQVQQFWRANRHKTVNENWDLGNSYVNHWEIAPSMCYMPESLKRDVFRALQPLLERWANNTELEPTACYGIRLYHRGSKLENHVDRLDTHAISAIINVDQQVEEEWPLEIYDHADVKHHVYLKPRDMVFYESASRIHGRPTPFNGTFYANFFVHFRPKHNWVDVHI